MSFYKNISIATILLFTLATTKLKAQQDTIKSLMDRVLFHKKVFPNVFFSYKGIGEYPHVLAPGIYSFIYPDSVIKAFYPDIIYDLSVTWENEKKLYTKTYLQHPQVGTVFIKSDIYSDPNLKYFLTFKSIFIDGSKAMVKLTTSCNCIDYTDGRKIFVEATLGKKRGIWKMKKVTVSEQVGCR